MQHLEGIATSTTVGMQGAKQCYEGVDQASELGIDSRQGKRYSDSDRHLASFWKNTYYSQ